jgi:hypothetical protein
MGDYPNSQKYIDLMDEYKRMRKIPGKREESISIREEALSLLRSGTVSPQAEEAVRYM